MKRFIFRAATAFAFLMSFWVVAWADDSVGTAPSPEDAVTLDDGSRLWFVELNSSPTSDGGDIATIEQERSTFRAGAAQVGLRYTEQHAFSKLWNGLSIAVHPSDVAKLDRIGGVGALYPVLSISLPEVAVVNEPDLLTALSMTGADVAQNTLGLSGAGVKVGIIDTGLDYDHADLGGDGVQRSNSAVFPTGRVVAGYDLVGDVYTGSNARVPDSYPDDCNGHGTHVSGIVGANGAARGVAPGVTFCAYRVFGCAGSTTSAIMIDAMERAFNDGVQIVNMSIGASFQWPQYPSAQASDRLVNHGVVVCASIGNSGSSGLYAASAPGVGKKVIGVASFENNFINLSAFTVSSDAHVTGYVTAAGAPPPPASGTFPIVRTGTVTTTNDGCAPLPSLVGKWALIRRGTCGFYVKARNAQLAGAIGVVLYNNAPGGLSPTVAGSPPVTIPVVAISGVEGGLIDSRLASGPVSITWGATISQVNPFGGLISDFSSFGDAPDLSVKPDIGAPGGFIRSTVPIELGSYDNFSGTSMASPHVAGGVALLLQAHPNIPSNAVRDILMNTADPHPLQADLSKTDNVHRQGAGMLDIPAAVLATTRIEPGKLGLGESEFGPVTKTLDITNSDASAVTYDLSNLAAAGTGTNTFSVSYNNFPASVSFSQNPVTVPGNGSASVDVTIAPNGAQPAGTLYGGYVVFSPQGGGQEYHVPYSGFAGDYQAIPSLTSGGAAAFPWLAKVVGPNLVKQPTGATYTLTGGDFPYFVLHLNHPASLLLMEVFDASTGQAWHRMLSEKYIGRNSTASGAYQLPWNGTTSHGNFVETVPNGQYVMKVSVLRALGDNTNPAHWDTWTSPTITLARPNITVQGLWLSQNMVEVGDQVTVSAAIHNTGGPANGVVVNFLDNGASFHSETIDFAAEESRVVTSAWTVDGAASHQLRVTASLLDAETDPSDNAFEIGVRPGEVVTGVGGPVPKVLALAPAQPNPSKGDMTVRFSLPKTGPVSLEVFDVGGRRVRSWSWSALPAGEHSVKWNGLTNDGLRAPTGVVVYRLTAMGRTLNQKAVRLQ